MNFDDTPDEATFRTKARAFLEANAPRRVRAKILEEALHKVAGLSPLAERIPPVDMPDERRRDYRSVFDPQRLEIDPSEHTEEEPEQRPRFAFRSQIRVRLI